MIVEVRTAEALDAKLELRQGGPGGRRAETTRRSMPGSDKIPLRVSHSANAGRAKLTVKLTDAAGDTVTEKFAVRIPAA